MANKKPSTSRTESLGHLTDLEAEMMNVIWDAAEPVSTQDIHAAVARDRETTGGDSFTLSTTFYTLERLTAMGLLQDEKRGKTRYFTAAQPREKVIARILARTHSKLGGGPLGKLLQGLTGLRTSKQSLPATDSEYIDRLLTEIRNLEKDVE